MSAPLRTGDWAGMACLIMGGGPSVGSFGYVYEVKSPVAPRGVCRHSDGVRQAFDRVIGINIAGERVLCDLAYVEDKRVAVLDIPWCERRIFHAVEPNLPPLDGWQLVGDTGPEWSDSLERGLVHASNAGVSALNLACVLGADPIYLIGFDCVSKDGFTQNYHAEYPEAWRQAGRVYDRFIADFERYAPQALAGGRRIVNLNPDSAIGCFEKIAGGARQ